MHVMRIWKFSAVRGDGLFSRPQALLDLRPANKDRTTELHVDSGLGGHTFTDQTGYHTLIY